MNATGERWAEPEIRRLRGQILERRGAPATEVEECYRLAVETARRMGARGFEAWANQSLMRWLAARESALPPSLPCCVIIDLNAQVNAKANASGRGRAPRRTPCGRHDPGCERELSAITRRCSGTLRSRLPCRRARIQTRKSWSARGCRLQRRAARLTLRAVCNPLAKRVDFDRNEKMTSAFALVI